jgi:APA family basic amino acid/polyamine antiporter
MTEGASRDLGFWALLALGINGIVGVGIFFVPSSVAALVPGLSGVWAYALTALALLPVAFTYGILGARFEEDGGPYVWARVAFGPTAAFAVGWVAYVSAVFSTAAVVAGLSEPVSAGLGFGAGWGARACALVCVSVLGVIAATGLRPSAQVWSVVTVLKLTPLLLLVAVGAWGVAPPSTRPPEVVDEPLSGLVRAMLVVVFATQGFEIVAVPAGHARRGHWSIPVATISSLVFAVLLYLALHAICVSTVPDLAERSQPLVAAAEVAGGWGFSRLVSVGTTVSAVGIAFGMFAMTPRYLAALGRDDGLGTWIGHETPARVPARALGVTVVLIAALVTIALGQSDSVGLGGLFVLSGVMVLMQYTVSALALGALAWRERCGIELRHAWPVPLVGVTVVVMAGAARWAELLVLGGALCVGLVLLLTRRMSGR